MDDRRRKGFTLIELLIVVAIIAILALIAVPNFLEAQTRAKISRTKADMRSMATAMEAYFVDWNSYIMGVGGADFAGDIGAWSMLTTPVAYMTTIPIDVFGRTTFGTNRDTRFATFELGVGNAESGAPRSWSELRSDPSGMPADSFEIESDGPDHADNTGGVGPAPSTGGFPPGWDVDPQRIVNSIYDPTNGTVSDGDIFRPGGAIHGGPALQIFYSITSQ